MGTSVLHIKTDIECKVFLFDEEKGVATPGKYYNLEVRKGEQHLHFISNDGEMYYDEIYIVENEDSDYVLELDKSKFESEVFDTVATEKELEDGFEDGYGVVYSEDGLQLLKCKNADLVSYTIKSGCKVIRRCAFVHDMFHLSRLKWINIPNTVTYIADYAFAHCLELTSVFIPSSVTHIGKQPFHFDEDLISIVIDGCNPKYDSRNNCNAVIESASNTLIIGCKETIIPDTIEHIGESAFEECKGLQSLNIPNSVVSIGGRAFAKCGAIRDDEGTQIRWIAGITSIRIPDSVTYIGNEAFRNCNCLDDVILSNSLTSIGERAFEGCGFNSVVLPSSIRIINKEAFSYCRGLETITIPDSVSVMGDGAFEGCDNMSSIVFQGEVHYIGQSCLRQCSSLHKIQISKGSRIHYERLLPHELHDILIEVND